MKSGISTNLNVTNSVACLKNSGFDFVFRYYSRTTTQPQKRLTQAEASAILAAGLTIGVVYEDLPTASSYFSTQRGEQDAAGAIRAATAIGQPAGSAIYFTVDYNASAADIQGPIRDYFAGLNQGMQAAGPSANIYAVGVYGSGAVCDFIKGQCGLAKYSWLSESTSFTGSSTYAAWDVNQAVPTVDVCGFTVRPQTYDANQAQDDFGGFDVLASGVSAATATT